jgi:hypothetical protein
VPGPDPPRVVRRRRRFADTDGDEAHTPRLLEAQSRTASPPAPVPCRRCLPRGARCPSMPAPVRRNRRVRLVRCRAGPGAGLQTAVATAPRHHQTSAVGRASAGQRRWPG